MNLYILYMRVMTYFIVVRMLHGQKSMIVKVSVSMYKIFKFQNLMSTTLEALRGKDRSGINFTIEQRILDTKQKKLS